jgi:hypothetical protein
MVQTLRALGVTSDFVTLPGCHGEIWARQLRDGSPHMPSLEADDVHHMMQGAWDRATGAFCPECKLCFTWKAALHPKLGDSSENSLFQLASMLSTTAQLLDPELRPFTENDPEVLLRCVIPSDWEERP